MSVFVKYMFNFIRKYIAKRHTFTDMDRLNSQTTRTLLAMRKQRLKAMNERLKELQLRQSEQQIEESIAELEEKINGGYDFDDNENDDAPVDSGDIDTVFSDFVKTILSSKKIPVAKNKTTLSDEEIEAISAQFTPSQIAAFKKYDYATQAALIKSQFPRLSDDAIKEALSRL